MGDFGIFVWMGSSHQMSVPNPVSRDNQNGHKILFEGRLYEMVWYYPSYLFGIYLLGSVYIKKYKEHVILKE